MDGFLAQDLSSTVLQRISCCRLFLQEVTLLSDISNLAGDQIERNARPGTKSTPSNDDAWPIQPRSNKASWRLWRKAISTSIYDNLMKNVLATQPGTFTFTKPLGFWLPNSEPRSSPHAGIPTSPIVANAFLSLTPSGPYTTTNSRPTPA